MAAGAGGTDQCCHNHLHSSACNCVSSGTVSSVDLDTSSGAVFSGHTPGLKWFVIYCNSPQACYYVEPVTDTVPLKRDAKRRLYASKPAPVNRRCSYRNRLRVRESA